MRRARVFQHTGTRALRPLCSDRRLIGNAQVAVLYREALAAHKEHFDVVAFAIFHAGYGPNNLEPFKRALESVLSEGHGQSQ